MFQGKAKQTLPPLVTLNQKGHAKFSKIWWTLFISSTFHLAKPIVWDGDTPPQVLDVLSLQNILVIKIINASPLYFM